MGLPSELGRLPSSVETSSGAARRSRRSMKLVNKRMGKLNEKILTDLTEGVAVHGTREPPGGVEKRRMSGSGRGRRNRFVSSTCIVVHE